MTLVFFGPAEPDLGIPEEWRIHNVAEVNFDSREVQVTIDGRTAMIARVVHYGETGRYVKYVISDNGFFSLFRLCPAYVRLAYAGISIKS